MLVDALFQSLMSLPFFFESPTQLSDCKVTAAIDDYGRGRPPLPTQINCPLAPFIRNEVDPFPDTLLKYKNFTLVSLFCTLAVFHCPKFIYKSIRAILVNLT